MTVYNDRNKGFLMMELSVGLTALAILLSALMVLLYNFRKVNHYQLMRQRCVAAGQAELDRIAVTGKELDVEDLNRLWPELTVSVERKEGAGQWSGLELIKVTAQAASFDRTVQVRLSRYILPREGG